MLDLKKFKFSSQSSPTVKNVNGIIHYGDKNDFYIYLTDLYLNSSKHNAIVNGKLQMIDGIVEGVDNDFIEFRRKCIKDFLIFGGFAIKIVKDLNNNIQSFSHIPFQNIRKLDDGENVAISSNWVRKNGVFKYYRNNAVEFIDLPIYRKDEIQPVSVFLFERLDYSGVYPIPDYIGGLQYIEMDYRVANFWNNTISKGFAASHIINIYSAGLTEEEKDIIDAQIQEMFSGDDNAGSYILNFVRKEGEGTDIQTIQQPNLDNLYKLLNDAITQEIFISHRVTSPMLFGVRTEGQLGGRNELLDAQNLFYSIYVKPTRNNIDRNIKSILGINYNTRDEYLVSQDILQLKDILTVDEIREALGYPPLGTNSKKEDKNEDF